MNLDPPHGDAADCAQILEEAERAAALTRHAQRPHEAPLYIGGARCCLDCEDVLDAPRLRAAPDAVRCLDCQCLHERKHAHVKP